jgi:hypothetical protein
LTPHPEYLRLDAGAYAQLVATMALQRERMDEIRAATNGGYALGNKQFREAMARALGRRVEQGKPGRPSRAQSKNHQSENQGQITFLTTPTAKKKVVCP